MCSHSNSIFQTKARIIAHKKVASDCFLMELEARSIARKGLPGQFVHLKINDSDVPLLRRPLSLHSISDSSVEVLYQIKGEGTYLLSKKKKDETVDLIGPLGNGFDLDNIPQGKKIILVGGGIGAAPLLALAVKLIKRYFGRQLLFFLGARSKELIIAENKICDLGISCRISTDDGSYGKKSLVTRMFEEEIKESDEKPGMVFACGPEGMLKVMAELSLKFKFPCQISLEENMACGIGACLGCSVPIRNSSKKDGFEYKLVCKDGPIFWASEVIFR